MLLGPSDGKRFHQSGQRRHPGLPLVEDISTTSGASSVSWRSLPRYPRSNLSAVAISLIDACRPSSSICWYRNARANAFTSAGSAHVVAAGARPVSCGVTIVVRPGRRRMVSGTRTLMVAIAVMPEAQRIRAGDGGPCGPPEAGAVATRLRAPSMEGYQRRSRQAYGPGADRFGPSRRFDGR